jgi:hypothetical protein
MTISLNNDTGIVLTYWTTETRPAAPTEGTMGYNTTLNQVEIWDSTSWTKVM